VDGDRASVIKAAERQMTECHTNACVANGRAYGDGFGLVTVGGRCVHLAETGSLFKALEEFIRE
jgi:hypothetical protein